MKGKTILEKYSIVQKLGQTAFNETYLAKDKSFFSRRRYVIKKFRPILGSPQLDRMRSLFHQEASVLKRLSGKNRQIPQLYEYCINGEEFYLVREWIKGLTLEQKVKRDGVFSEAEVEHILDSILVCLKYIHSHGIVYRQLTPSSIILKSTKEGYLPVPIYFGGVKELSRINQSRQRNLVLTIGYEYVSPEQKQGRSLYASDLYSLGLTAIYMLTGKTPVELPFDPRTKRLLWQQEIPNLKIHLARVIDRSICPNFQDRFISAEQMHFSLHSRPVSISMPSYKTVKPTHLTSDTRIITTLLLSGLGILGLVFVLLNLDFTQLMPNNFEQSVSESEIEPLAQELEPLDQKLEPLSDVEPIDLYPIPRLTVGVSQQQVTESLGQPTKISKGYWQDSEALLYRNFIPNQLDLGFLVDNQTKAVRQTEMTFTDSVELLTIKEGVRQMLSQGYSPEIERYIEQVYQKTSDRHNFQIKDRQGVIQRNPQNRIYIGVWDRGFHN